MRFNVSDELHADSSLSPKYALGHSISLGALCLCLALTCTQIGYLHWENKKRARGDRDERLLQDNAHRLGHRHPLFRYTL
jgi:hypothetical protein